MKKLTIKLKTLEVRVKKTKLKARTTILPPTHALLQIGNSDMVVVSLK